MRLIENTSSAVGMLLALNQVSGEDVKMVWIYRTVIASLLAILGTLFVSDRLLPYPWNVDKPMVNARITMLESQASIVAADMGQMKKDLATIKMYLIQKNPSPAIPPSFH